MSARPPTALVAALLLCLAGADGRAASLRFCDAGAPPGPAAYDRMLRFAAIVKAELDDADAPAVLVSRSGLDLDFLGLRYSHAGLSVRSGGETRWEVRQLYFACDEQRPRIFDQGMSAFVMGTHDATTSYVSAVLLPGAAGDALRRAASDNRQALDLLGPDYSANAFAFDTRYQNCNQWLAEMLAAAWGPPIDGALTRPAAQAWLQQAGYTPTAIDLGWRPLMWAGLLAPWVHEDDHPAEDIDARRYRISMPASLEAFVRVRVPGATRIEFCLADRSVVVHRGWDAVADGCRPGQGDEVVVLD